MDVIADTIRNIIVDELGVAHDEVALQSRFIEDLGADSLDLVELVMRFEEEFALEIPDEDAERIDTVGAAVHYVKAHLEKGKVHS